MLRLDIGCGGQGTRWDGFTGVDLLASPGVVQLDFVRDPLPWAAASVDEIVALHLIEHLERRDGRTLISRALALLKPGGILTLTCPDLAILARKYLDADEAFWNVRHTTAEAPLRWPGATLADKLNWVVHGYGHQWAYDLQSLTFLAVEAGAAVEDISGIEGSRYHTRTDHETGIVIRADGHEPARARVSADSALMEARLAAWEKEMIQRGCR